MIQLDVRTNIESVRRQLRGKDKEIDAAASRALNRAASSVRSVAVKELAKATGIRPQAAIREKLRMRKATPRYLIAEVGAVAYTPNLARFSARQTKRGISANAWAKRKIYRGTFLGNQGRTAFKRTGAGRLPIEPVHGPRMHREFAAAVIQKAMEVVAIARFVKEFAHEVGRRTRPNP
jgi:hypothetical protein